ncbi:MAG: peptidase T [Erysipelotrichaceae bacterium]
MRAYERLIKYTAYPSASNEHSNTCPSTKEQIVFGQDLVKEMIEIGISDACIDDNGYVYGTIPSNIDREDAPIIGFIAHMDVVDVVPYSNIKTNIIKNYDGKDIVLNKELDIVMKVKDYESLTDYVGKDLLVTDGTTLLGADDKAGIAEILTFAQILINDDSIKHGTIKIGFTPDEEIGSGADLFDIEKFGADFAYTCDGGAFGEVEYETFNAASLNVTIQGLNIHPGSAKDKMINSLMVGHEFIEMLPKLECPEKTSGYEGFYHIDYINGNVEKTEISGIIRDHDINLLNNKKEYVHKIADELNNKYGKNTVVVETKDSYYNMKDKILPNYHLIEVAQEVIKECGRQPITLPVRGGTDGCRLSYMGLPCPNLGTGSHNCHGKFEYTCIDDMDLAVTQLIKIVEKYATIVIK